MNESIKEILSLAESEANWLDQVARHFGEFAAMFKEQKKLSGICSLHVIAKEHK
jgi:hypothetical protein